MDIEIKTWLYDILNAINEIEGFFSDRPKSFEAHKSDLRTRRAVERNIEIIGEAANRLPEDFKDTHSKIDWHRIRGFRNRIVHDYLGIDYAIVWEIKNLFPPGLIADLRALTF